MSDLEDQEARTEEEPPENMSHMPNSWWDLDRQPTHARTNVSREAGLHEETKRSGAKEDAEVRRNEED